MLKHTIHTYTGVEMFMHTLTSNIKHITGHWMLFNIHSHSRFSIRESKIHSKLTKYQNENKRTPVAICWFACNGRGKRRQVGTGEGGKQNKMFCWYTKRPIIFRMLYCVCMCMPKYKHQQIHQKMRRIERKKQSQMRCDFLCDTVTHAWP